MDGVTTCVHREAPLVSTLLTPRTFPMISMTSCTSYSSFATHSQTVDLLLESIHRLCPLGLSTHWASKTHLSRGDEWSWPSLAFPLHSSSALSTTPLSNSTSLEQAQSSKSTEYCLTVCLRDNNGYYYRSRASEICTPCSSTLDWIQLTFH